MGQRYYNSRLICKFAARPRSLMDRIMDSGSIDRRSIRLGGTNAAKQRGGTTCRSPRRRGLCHVNQDVVEHNAGGGEFEAGAEDKA